MCRAPAPPCVCERCPHPYPSSAALSISAPHDRIAFIRANLPLVAAPGAPEIVLHRAQPTSGLWRLAGGVDGFASPYWAFPWPGGQALARHVLDQPECVVGRRVLDLGAGGGLVAIAAAKAGAAHVIAAEIDPCGIVALELNAAANGVVLEVVAEDLLEATPPPVDLVLVGDLFYEHSLARRVTAFLARCRTAGIAALVGDVGRAYLPTRRLRAHTEHEVVEFGVSENRTTSAQVFAFDASD